MEIFSTGPNLYVEFIANDHWPGQGFKATYYFQHVNELQNFNEIQQAGNTLIRYEYNKRNEA